MSTNTITLKVGYNMNTKQEICFPLSIVKFCGPSSLYTESFPPNKCGE
jgi:hypothetical protein